MPSCAVAHAIGNVRKPGIALLFAPEQPMVKEHDVKKWHVVYQNRFDCWEGPLRIQGTSAFREMEAYNLERRISMYDQAEWVADLNVLKSLGQSLICECVVSMVNIAVMIHPCQRAK
ncbi:predicted protein [Aspergillus nidulans FGSC A4]|uniref:Uncharacterized protein n=1 Tax=Emericella nidulans (strain FGSC A4 / ATCC 38163 / CBS 112.46 / NRRL 194 / M139) TaxID=227321 RepID=Q5AS16_EMENI|nr:hypothetical protein [Aspergillus nidulans FGSC A4]EAA64128.1 predicted protein [Aspergillus nidulans FGSC A4]CBF84675.1 TPA: conserved hypothetical protein [Aspergillus nidulans FGSC A4]|eukprot:XP_682183.1 predicted protein [Aspergillus nidulans FGSC A4]